jgi:hypothetical protein
MNPITGLSIFTTVYLQILLATNPNAQTFPLAVIQPNGTFINNISRSALQAELNSRSPIQNEIVQNLNNPNYAP